MTTFLSELNVTTSQPLFQAGTPQQYVSHALDDDVAEFLAVVDERLAAKPSAELAWQAGIELLLMFCQLDTAGRKRLADDRILSAVDEVYAQLEGGADPATIPTFAGTSPSGTPWKAGSVLLAIKAILERVASRPEYESVDRNDLDSLVAGIVTDARERMEGGQSYDSPDIRAAIDTFESALGGTDAYFHTVDGEAFGFRGAVDNHVWKPLQQDESQAIDRFVSHAGEDGLLQVDDFLAAAGDFGMTVSVDALSGAGSAVAAEDAALPPPVDVNALIDEVTVNDFLDVSDLFAKLEAQGYSAGNEFTRQQGSLQVRADYFKAAWQNGDWNIRDGKVWANPDNLTNASALAARVVPVGARYTAAQMEAAMTALGFDIDIAPAQWDFIIAANATAGAEAGTLDWKELQRALYEGYFSFDRGTGRAGPQVPPSPEMGFSMLLDYFNEAASEGGGAPVTADGLTREQLENAFATGLLHVEGNQLKFNAALMHDDTRAAFYSDLLNAAADRLQQDGTHQSFDQEGVVAYWVSDFRAMDRAGQMQKLSDINTGVLDIDSLFLDPVFASREPRDDMVAVADIFFDSARGAEASVSPSQLYAMLQRTYGDAPGFTLAELAEAMDFYSESADGSLRRDRFRDMVLDSVLDLRDGQVALDLDSVPIQLRLVNDVFEIVGGPDAMGSDKLIDGLTRLGLLQGAPDDTLLKAMVAHYSGGGDKLTRAQLQSALDDVAFAVEDGRLIVNATQFAKDNAWAAARAARDPWASQTLDAAQLRAWLSAPADGTPAGLGLDIDALSDADMQLLFDTMAGNGASAMSTDALVEALDNGVLAIEGAAVRVDAKAAAAARFLAELAPDARFTGVDALNADIEDAGFTAQLTPQQFELLASLYEMSGDGLSKAGIRQAVVDGLLSFSDGVLGFQAQALPSGSVDLPALLGEVDGRDSLQDWLPQEQFTSDGLAALGIGSAVKGSQFGLVVQAYDGNQDRRLDAQELRNAVDESALQLDAGELKFHVNPRIAEAAAAALLALGGVSGNGEIGAAELSAALATLGITATSADLEGLLVQTGAGTGFDAAELQQLISTGVIALDTSDFHPERAVPPTAIENRLLVEESPDFAVAFDGDADAPPVDTDQLASDIIAKSGELFQRKGIQPGIYAGSVLAEDFARLIGELGYVSDGSLETNFFRTLVYTYSERDYVAVTQDELELMFADGVLRAEGKVISVNYEHPTVVDLMAHALASETNQGVYFYASASRMGYTAKAQGFTSDIGWEEFGLLADYANGEPKGRYLDRSQVKMLLELGAIRVEGNRIRFEMVPELDATLIDRAIRVGGDTPWTAERLAQTLDELEFAMAPGDARLLVDLVGTDGTLSAAQLRTLLDHRSLDIEDRRVSLLWTPDLFAPLEARLFGEREELTGTQLREGLASLGLDAGTLTDSQLATAAFAEHGRISPAALHKALVEGTLLLQDGHVLLGEAREGVAAEFSPDGMFRHLEQDVHLTRARDIFASVPDAPDAGLTIDELRAALQGSSYQIQAGDTAFEAVVRAAAGADARLSEAELALLFQTQTFVARTGSDGITELDVDLTARIGLDAIEAALQAHQANGALDAEGIKAAFRDVGLEPRFSSALVELLAIDGPPSIDTVLRALLEKELVVANGGVEMLLIGRPAENLADRVLADGATLASLEDLAAGLSPFGIQLDTANATARFYFRLYAGDDAALGRDELKQLLEECVELGAAQATEAGETVAATWTDGPLTWARVQGVGPAGFAGYFADRGLTPAIDQRNIDLVAAAYPGDGGTIDIAKAVADKALVIENGQVKLGMSHAFASALVEVIRAKASAQQKNVLDLESLLSILAELGYGTGDLRQQQALLERYASAITTQHQEHWNQGEVSQIDLKVNAFTDDDILRLIGERKLVLEGANSQLSVGHTPDMDAVSLTMPQFRDFSVAVRNKIAEEARKQDKNSVLHQFAVYTDLLALAQQDPGAGIDVQACQQRLEAFFSDPDSVAAYEELHRRVIQDVAREQGLDLAGLSTQINDYLFSDAATQYMAAMDPVTAYQHKERYLSMLSVLDPDAAVKAAEKLRNVEVSLHFADPSLAAHDRKQALLANRGLSWVVETLFDGWDAAKKLGLDADELSVLKALVTYAAEHPNAAAANVFDRTINGHLAQALQPIAAANGGLTLDQAYGHVMSARIGNRFRSISRFFSRYPVLAGVNLGLRLVHMIGNREGRGASGWVAQSLWAGNETSKLINAAVKRWAPAATGWQKGLSYIGKTLNILGDVASIVGDVMALQDPEVDKYGTQFKVGTGMSLAGAGADITATVASLFIGESAGLALGLSIFGGIGVIVFVVGAALQTAAAENYNADEKRKLLWEGYYLGLNDKPAA